MVRRIMVSGVIAGIVLLALSYVALHLTVVMFPSIAEEYFNPVFSLGGDKTILYFIHPFVLAIALSWFWERFKSMFGGSFVMRGIELGIVYGLVATLPAMWLIFSSLDFSLTLVVTWFLYGIFQAIVAGLIYAKTNP
jgi:hypothetical protein